MAGPGASWLAEPHLVKTLNRHPFKWCRNAKNAAREYFRRHSLHFKQDGYAAQIP